MYSPARYTPSRIRVYRKLPLNNYCVVIYTKPPPPASPPGYYQTELLYHTHLGNNISLRLRELWPWGRLSL